MPPKKRAKFDALDDEETAAEGVKELSDAVKAREGESNTSCEGNSVITQELEKDASDDTRAKLTKPVVVLTPDTTMNIMQSTRGNMLMTLNEGGLQYLLAGARANVGVKSGRYMFEARIVENLSQVEITGSQTRTPVPRNLLRIGFSVAHCVPILGDSDESICFDSEGNLLYNRKQTSVAQKFAVENTMAVVLNLCNESCPNASTISLFKDGVRVCEPQPLPDSLKGKALYPATTFKNMTVHLHFGPEPQAPLPFKCRMIQEAATDDSVVTSYPPPKDGKHDVVFPVMLPDEGTFDWLDWFLMRNPQYTELSERSVVEWALRSGLWRPQAHSYKSSNDRPDMNFGIPHLDDGSVKQILAMAATVQQRDFIVMEVKGNLTAQERIEAIKKWQFSHFTRTARIMVGDPEAEYKEHVFKVRLEEKQAKADAEYNMRKQERARKRLIERRQKQVEKARKKAERIKKRMDEEKKRKAENEQKGEGEANDVEEKIDGDVDEEEEEEKEQPTPEEDEPPPQVELTDQEKNTLYVKKLGAINDLSAYVLSQNFPRFTLPQENEGFDAIDYAWLKPVECKEYIRRWHLDRKMTTRIEDIQPSDWFRSRWQDWQRDLQIWHLKHMEYKDPAKRAALIAAAIRRKDEREKKLKEEKGYGSEPAEKAAQKAGDKKNETIDQAKEGNDKADSDVASKEKKTDKEKDNDKGTEKGKEEGNDKDGETNADKENGKDEKTEKLAEEEDPMKLLEEELDRQELDIFGVDDIMDISTGEPLFSSFAFEDWALLSLRFELHLLVHSFMRDCNDADRTGIHPDHLAFYYNKYYKKGLNPKSYGVENVEDLISLVRDTVIIVMKVIESQLIDDLESNEIFVKLTEEARRERQIRLDSGDQTAQLKFQSRPQDHGLLSLGATAGVGRTSMRPSTQATSMVTPTGPGIVQRPTRMSIPQLTGGLGKGGLQHSYGSTRPQQWYSPRYPHSYGAARPSATPQLGGRGLPRSSPYQQSWRYNSR